MPLLGDPQELAMMAASTIIDPAGIMQWLPVWQFSKHICVGHPNGDAIQSDKSTIIRHLNTDFPCGKMR